MLNLNVLGFFLGSFRRWAELFFDYMGGRTETRGGPGKANDRVCHLLHRREYLSAVGPLDPRKRTTLNRVVLRAVNRKVGHANRKTDR